MPDTQSAPVKLPAVGPLLVAQVRYQARLLLANGRAAVVCIGLPVILLVASGTGYSHPSAADAARFAAFGLTLTAWNAHGVRLVAAREAGVLKRWRATPLPRWCYFLGRIVATVGIAVLAGAVTIAVAVLFYRTHLTLTAALALLVILVLGAAAWSATATALTSAISTVGAATPALIVVYFPVVIVSGVLGPISEPGWLSTMARYLPAQPLIAAATSSLQHTTGAALLPAHDLITLAAWAAAGLAVAVATFRWEPHRPSQRRPAPQDSAADVRADPAADVRADPAVNPGAARTQHSARRQRQQLSSRTTSGH
jgi:ABC-2 type transport system permease protein